MCGEGADAAVNRGGAAGFRDAPQGVPAGGGVAGGIL